MGEQGFRISDRRLAFTFATMVLCYGIGSYVMCADMRMLPRNDMPLRPPDPPGWDPEPRQPPFSPHYSNPERFWEWRMGNGYVSELENIVMMLSLFFGFMRTVDLFKTWDEYDKERAWRYFWDLCEQNNYIPLT